VVAETGGIEPVSASKNPCYQGKYQGISPFLGLSRTPSQRKATAAQGLTAEIPYATEQGILRR
jgi:hypothetical protein